MFQACQNSGNVVTFGIGGEIFGELDTGSLGACVTTVRGNKLSTAAYYNNCRALEPEFAATNPSGRPYPYSFYGNPAYTARSIAGCIYFLRAFHTGQLPPGPGGAYQGATGSGEVVFRAYVIGRRTPNGRSQEVVASSSLARVTGTASIP